MTRNHLSRRTMLKTLLWTPPALMFGRYFADADTIQPLYEPRIVPKGETIRLAQIGVFHRGGGLYKSFGKHTDTQVRFTAFADLRFTDHDSRMKEYPDVPCFRDYREMFEKMHDQIDAVVIATPDHAHFPMVMHAMLLGKHVYVEKPMAQNVYECRLLGEAARACKVVTQMGNQGHSGVGTFQFKEWVEAGVINNVKKIDAWMANSRRWHGWTDEDYPQGGIPPAGYDWDLWLCRRPFRPYSDKLINGNWRSWFEFGCGALGDWGAHILDAAHRYLKLGQPYEISAKLTGPDDLIYPQGSVLTMKFKAREGMPAVELNWYDGKGNVPPAPSGYDRDLGGVGSLVYTPDYVIKGRSHGALYRIFPEEKMTQLLRAGKLPRPEGDFSSHYHNFLNACQGIEPSNSPFEVAAPLSELLCLGCVAQRYGGTLHYDADRMKITNHPEADKMLRGPQVREGWKAYDRYEPAKSKRSRIKNPDNVAWEQLIRDEQLSNWQNPYDLGTAEVVNGEVHLKSDEGKWFLLTKKEYANFVFEGEVKMPAGKGNSGFLFRCRHRENKAWGYQAEVDPSSRAWSGGLYDEGRRRWFISPNRDQAASDAEKKESIAAFRKRAGDSFKQNEWNRYRIVCIGSHIQIFVNGTLTTDIYDSVDLKGPIGIQHHGEKGLVYKFRNLRIKDLGVGGEIYYPHRQLPGEPAKTADAAVPAPKLKGQVYEAEEAVLNDTQKAANHPGFQGSAFADFGGADSSVEWDNVQVDKKGKYRLTFSYAAGNDRPCRLLINGHEVGKVAFRGTGGWSHWRTESVQVNLDSGENTVKLAAIDAGPNLDAMAVTQ